MWGRPGVNCTWKAPWPAKPAKAGNQSAGTQVYSVVLRHSVNNKAGGVHEKEKKTIKNQPKFTHEIVCVLNLAYVSYEHLYFLSLFFLLPLGLDYRLQRVCICDDCHPVPRMPVDVELKNRAPFLRCT